MARNGRSQGDPWSSRQTGIYQQYCFKRRYSSWILLQVSEDMRRQLGTVLSHSSQDQNKNEHPMFLHLMLISIAARDWHDYLEHLQAQLSSLVHISRKEWGDC